MRYREPYAISGLFPTIFFPLPFPGMRFPDRKTCQNILRVFERQKHFYLMFSGSKMVLLESKASRSYFFNFFVANEQKQNWTFVTVL